MLSMRSQSPPPTSWAHMFSLDDDTLVLSATDLTNHLACAHLTQQRLAIARGERTKPPPVDDPHGDLVRQRGDEHETEQLAKLVATAHGEHVDLTMREPVFTREGLEALADEALDAMRRGVALISQGVLFDGRWQGRVDVLRRVPIASDLGAHSYEVIDMKLARQIKPHVVHQLSLYSGLLARAQGLQPPVAYLILGDGSMEPVELTRYGALHRHVVRRVEAVASAPAVATYPEPVSHCGICRLQGECRARL